MIDMDWIMRFCFIASLIVVAVGLIFIFVYIVDHWSDGDVPEGSCNIALGQYAGYYWTTERLQFVFAMPSIIPDSNHYAEYSTTMTPQEYAIVFRVVGRASRNLVFREIPKGAMK